jgi:spore coat polysaccharide biosynthesis protein SpsF
MKTIAIIQARMGSSRLPGKVLMPLGETCVLDYIVSRTRMIAGVAEVVVATTTDGRDDAIADWCASKGVAVYRGSETNVLSRFLEAAAPRQPDTVIRVTADNPFFDYETASRCVELGAAERADLVRFEPDCYPLGMAVELVDYEALRKIGRLATEPRHLEHVTLYAYEHPEQFRIVRAPVPEALRHPELRITMDTEEDYQLMRAVASAFPGMKAVSTAEVVSFLLTRPELVRLNRHIEQKPVV